MPDIFHPETVENMLSEKGAEMEIDVIQMLCYFVLEEENEEMEESSDEDENGDGDNSDENN